MISDIHVTEEEQDDPDPLLRIQRTWKINATVARR